jgi:undecaprenyl-diphosphatase
MYLGVHTPADVLVSVVIALILIFGLYPLIQKCFDNTKVMRVLLLTMVLMSAGLLAFVSLYKFPADVDVSNLASGTKNAYKMLGCTLGIWIAFEVDNKYLHFETKAVIWAQILKFVLGIIPLLGIKEGLRIPLNAIFSGSYLADGVRYFLIVLFAGCIWPLTFKWFHKLGNK